MPMTYSLYPAPNAVDALVNSPLESIVTALPAVIVSAETNGKILAGEAPSFINISVAMINSYMGFFCVV